MPTKPIDLINRIKKLTLKGDYREALALAKAGMKTDPENLELRYQYAKMLGDYADELPQARKTKLKRESIAILKPLLKKLDAFSPLEGFGVALNYYYQSEKFREMYAFGKRFASKIPDRGFYAQGIASGLLAQNEHELGHLSKSRAWAKRSVQAWEKYPLKNEKYYFAHYSYAKALALDGRSKEALARLKIAARLAKRPLTDWEFADVLKLTGVEA